MIRLLRLAPAILAFGGLAVTASAEQALLHDYASVDGRHRYAVGLQLDAPSVREGAVSHVVLVDTSATQIGEHRSRALGVVDAFLSQLPATDTASVIAYDVKPVEVASTAAPTDAAADAGKVLASRVPAGASDVLAAVEAAMAKLPQGGVITLVGDGMSVADLVKPSELAPVAQAARDRGIAIQSFAVGSSVDLVMLGVLANQTGGIVVVDDPSADQSIEVVGRELAAAARIAPIVPSTVSLDDVDGAVIGKPLPLRSDRMTYLLAIGEPSGDVAISVDGRTQDTTVRTAGNTFLAGIAESADATDGIVNPLAGDQLLGRSRESFERAVAKMEQQGEAALARRDWNKAEEIAFQIRKVDPNNVRAVVILEAVGNKAMMLVQGEAAGAPGGPALGSEPGVQPGFGAKEATDGQDGLEIGGPSGEDANEPQGVEARQGMPAPGTIAPPATGINIPEDPLLPLDEAEIGPIDLYRQRQVIREQQLNAAIEEALEDSRALIETDIEAAVEVLRRARGAVKTDGDVRAELRESLLRRVESRILDAESRRDSLVARQQLAQNRIAEVEAQQRLIDAIGLEEQKLEQLTEQVAALLAQGAAGNEEAWEEAEKVARVIDSMRPGNATGAATIFNSEAAGQLDKAYRLRAIRADKFLAQLYEVERSAIPFPDEPPVNYPTPERWQEITEMRAKYKSVDLHQNSPNEEEILRALDKNTQLEFIATPLSEAIQFISELHGITILIDNNSIEDEGISPDEPIDLFLSDVSLRSAFKIMLEDLGLTYVIRDEVMQIVSITEAEQETQVRVYPVADLVIPIQVLGGGAGGLGGGGIGGGGGGGIGGGGGGGIGGGGGGGGFFSIPVDDVAPSADAKKKAND